MAYKEKYRLYFKDLNNEGYMISISSNGYNGGVTDLEGGETPAKFDVPAVDDQLAPLRGRGMAITLQASPDVDVSEFGSEKERQYLVQLKKAKNGIYRDVLFSGFILPDGIDESFTDEIYDVSLDCTDGLGLLKDLAFVDETGLFYTGRLSAIHVIVACLKRIGLGLNINVAVNIYPNGENVNDCALEKAFFNSERYLKDPDNTPMNCEEVLISILTTYNACITQRENEWYIYRPNELALQYNGVKFFKYSPEGVLLGSFTKDLGVSIGSHINESPIHHINENQRTRTQKTYKAFRVNYKFGLVKALTTNPYLDNFENENGIQVPVGWNRIGTNPNFTLTYDNGLFITNGGNDCLRSDGVNVLAGQVLAFELTVKLPPEYQPGETRASFEIIVGSYTYDTSTSSWLDTTNSASYGGITPPIMGDDTITYNLPPLPTSGVLYIKLNGEFRIAQSFGVVYRAWYKFVQLRPIAETNDIKGEFHTVTQKWDYSYIPDNKVVYNGDNNGDVTFVGAITKSNGTQTTLWNRPYSPGESKPILRVMAEDVVRMHQKPSKKFTGDYYGYIDYLSVISISGLPGLFMPSSMQFLFMDNSGSYELLQIQGAEVDSYNGGEGTEYVLDKDYGTVIKPLIR